MDKILSDAIADGFLEETLEYWEEEDGYDENKDEIIIEIDKIVKCVRGGFSN